MEVYLGIFLGDGCVVDRNSLNYINLSPNYSLFMLCQGSQATAYDKPWIKQGNFIGKSSFSATITANGRHPIPLQFVTCISVRIVEALIITKYHIEIQKLYLRAFDSAGREHYMISWKMRYAL